MRIGELAKKSSCDVETIRFYEKEGLFDVPMREGNGYRSYTGVHLVQLNFIRHCRSLGIGLSEIRILRNLQANPESACQEVNQLVDKQIKRVRQQIEAYHLLEHQLCALRDTCHANQKTSECGIMRNLTQASEGEGCSCHLAQYLS